MTSLAGMARSEINRQILNSRFKPVMGDCNNRNSLSCPQRVTWKYSTEDNFIVKAYVYVNMHLSGALITKTLAAFISKS
jgi:hypothetical protein